MIPKLFKTIDGHYVRSRGEMLIADWLYSNGFRYLYDKVVRIDINYCMLCDFYLPELEVFIEYWGLNTDEYNKRRIEKERYYRKLRLRLFPVENYHFQDLDKHLSKLHHYRTISFNQYIKSKVSLPIEKVKELRRVKKVHLFGKRIKGEVVSLPEIGKTINEIPYVKVGIYGNGEIVTMQVWGDDTISNIQVAQSLTVGDEVIIYDPWLPPAEYCSSDIWVNERNSTLMKLIDFRHYS